MAEKSRRWSPYNYGEDNPIKNTDPDGMKIIFAVGASEQFKKQFAQAVKFMNAHHTAGNLASLQKSSKVYTIAETKNPYNDDYQIKSRTINWNPNQALETTNGHALSPATILGHEADHANQDDKHHDQFLRDGNTPDAHYTDKEEKRVITGSEQTTAKAHGDIGPDEVTRTDHKGKFDLIPVSNPGSNGEIKIIAPRKKHDKNGTN